MAAAKDDDFGQELLWTLHKEEITKPEHSCVLYAHWALIRNGLKCIGLGDAKEFTGDEDITELLPEGWSKGPNYLMRYLKDKKLYILRVSVMADDAIVSLIRAEDMKINSLVHSLQPEKGGAWKELTRNVKEKLVEPFIDKEKPKVCPLGEPRDIGFRDVSPTFPQSHRQLFDPDPCLLGVGVGSSDLDPLGRFGPGGPSGMLFRPRHPGSYRPGARFDPILPGFGRGGNPPGPDPDHFRPPDFPPGNFF